jgi:hypothetical protein
LCTNHDDLFSPKSDQDFSIKRVLPRRIIILDGADANETERVDKVRMVGRGRAISCSKCLAPPTLLVPSRRHRPSGAVIGIVSARKPHLTPAMALLVVMFVFYL